MRDVNEFSDFLFHSRAPQVVVIKFIKEPWGSYHTKLFFLLIKKKKKKKSIEVSNVYRHSAHVPKKEEKKSCVPITHCSNTDTISWEIPTRSFSLFGNKGNIYIYI